MTIPLWLRRYCLEFAEMFRSRKFEPPYYLYTSVALGQKRIRTPVGTIRVIVDPTLKDEWYILPAKVERFTEYVANSELGYDDWEDISDEPV